MFGKELRKQIEREVMRADAKNRFINFSLRPIQTDFHLFASFIALHAAGNDSQPICLHQ